MNTSFMRFGSGAGRSLIAVSVTLLMSSISLAQWPKSYLEPKILWTGPDARAGDVMAFADGSVMVVHDRQDGAVRRVRNPIFDAAGKMLHNGQSMSYRDAVCVKAVILPPDNLAELANVSLQYREGSIDGNSISYRYQGLYANNTPNEVASYFANHLQGAVHNPGTGNNIILYNPIDRAVNGAVNSSLGLDQLPLTRGTARNFAGHVGDSLCVVIAFERNGDQPETPSEIWTYVIDKFYNPPVRNLTKAAEQPGESLTHPKIARMNPNQLVLAWRGSIGTENRLYTKILSNVGAAVSPVRLVMTDVVDYTITSSTLGHPVFAAVQRNDAVDPPVDTLYAGLIDANVGAYVALPMTTGLGIKIKALRQETNGDFSLVYSVPEAGTTLLKVRRISGTTAGTLWETTVADLGTASDELIERYPNTFVSATEDGVLYLLTRYDKPFSNVSSYMVWRLRPDGQLGADPLTAAQNVKVTKINDTSADVSWTDTNTAETGYIVGRKPVGASEYSIVGSVGANTTVYQDLNVPAGQSHYVVAAYDETTGNYVLSNEVLYSP